MKCTNMEPSHQRIFGLRDVAQDWRFFALASAFFATLTAIFGKVGVTSINSNLATLIRTCVILLITMAIVSWRNEWRLPSEIDKKSILFLFLSALATGGSWLCYYRALQLGPVSKVAPIDKFSVALTILLAFLFLGEALDWKTILGGLLVVCGTIVLVI